VPTLQGRPPPKPRPSTSRRCQPRPRYSEHHPHWPQPAHEVDCTSDSKPRPQARPQLAQRSHPSHQAALHLHRIEAQLAQHPTVHHRLVQAHQPPHGHDPPTLCTPGRTVLAFDQVLGPALTSTCRDRGTHQARPWIPIALLYLAEHRLPAVWHMAHRVQRERLSVLTAAHLPQRVPWPSRPRSPASSMDATLARRAAQAQQASVRHPRRHNPPGLITTVLDDDESSGRTWAGRGTLLQLASALRGRACRQSRGVASPLPSGLVVLLAALYCHPHCNQTPKPTATGGATSEQVRRERHQQGPLPAPPAALEDCSGSARIE